MKKIRNILIRSTNWIGDAIMTTPAITMLGERFSDASITVAARPWVLPVFSENPFVQKTIAMETDTGARGLMARFRTALELRRHGFDMALLFPNSFDAAFTAWLAGIPFRAGYATDMRSMILSRAVPVPQWKNRRHEVFYYINLVDQLDLAGREAWTGDHATPGEPPLILRVAHDASRQARGLLVQGGVGENDLVIGFNPGAAFGPAKCWPVEKFTELGRMLVEHISSRGRKVWIVVLGTDREKIIGDKICAPLGNTALNLAGRTDLPQVMALIEQMDLLVTNDSGLMHVGAALGRPLVALFGSTNPVTTGPWSNKSVIVSNEMECAPCLKRECPSDFMCMKGLEATQVLDACMGQIGKFVL